MGTSAVRVGDELSQHELVERDLDEVSVLSPGSHQRQVTHGAAAGLKRPQHLQFVRLAHRAIIEAVTL